MPSVDTKFDVSNQTAIAKRFVLYLEGYKARFSQATVVGSKTGSASMTVAVPFDRKGAVKNLAAKTIGQMFFVGSDDNLYLIFEGELVVKDYQFSNGGIPRLSLVFSGIAANYDATRIGTPTDLGSNAAASMELALANEAGLMVLSGTSPVAGGTQTFGVNSFSRSAATESMIPNTMLKAMTREPKGPKSENSSVPNYALADAYAAVMSKFLSPTRAEGVIVKASNIGIFSSIAHFRFNLIDGIVGAASNQLVQTFADPSKTHIWNDFMNAAIGRYATGEHSVRDIMDVLLKQLWHDSIEPICPGLVYRKPVGTEASGSGPPRVGNGPDGSIGVIPRIMSFPSMLNANPPTCNVFMGPIIKSANFGVTIMKPTRMLVTQVLQLHPEGAATIRGILPEDLKSRMVVREGNTSRIVFANGITEEEVSIGVHAVNVSNPMPNPEALDTDFLDNFIGATSQLRFIEQRSALQNGSIEMSFNPYPVQGLPGLYYNPLSGVIRGNVFAVQHVLTPNSGSTTVAMSNCEMSADGMDNVLSTGLNLYTGKQEALSRAPHIAAVPQIDDGLPFTFKEAVYRLDHVTASKVSDIYLPLLGVKSITDWFKDNKGSTPTVTTIPNTKDKPKNAPANLNYTGELPYVRGVAEEIYRYMMSDPDNSHKYYRRMVARPLVALAEMTAFYGRKDKKAVDEFVTPAADKKLRGALISDVEILDFPGVYVGTGLAAGDTKVKDFTILVNPSEGPRDPTDSDQSAAAAPATVALSTDIVSDSSITMADRAAAVFNYLVALEISKDVPHG